MADFKSSSSFRKSFHQNYSKVPTPNPLKLVKCSRTPSTHLVDSIAANKHKIMAINCSKRTYVILLSANLTKWSIGNRPTNCLSVFDHFVGLAFKVKPSIKINQNLFMVKCISALMKRDKYTVYVYLSKIKGSI